jgi:hypothetical protein
VNVLLVPLDDGLPVVALADVVVPEVLVVPNVMLVVAKPWLPAVNEPCVAPGAFSEALNVPLTDEAVAPPVANPPTPIAPFAPNPPFALEDEFEVLAGGVGAPPAIARPETARSEATSAEMMVFFMMVIPFL